MLITKKINIFFHHIQILKFFKNSPAKFLDILIVPIMYKSGKVKKVQGNKIGITIYS
jgi:hypothetical protein